MECSWIEQNPLVRFRKTSQFDLKYPFLTLRAWMEMVWRPVTNSRWSSGLPEDIWCCDISHLAVRTQRCRRQCGKIGDWRVNQLSVIRLVTSGMNDVLKLSFWLLSWRLLDGWIKHELICWESRTDESQPDEAAVPDYELWLDDQSSGFTVRSPVL